MLESASSPAVEACVLSGWQWGLMKRANDCWFDPTILERRCLIFQFTISICFPTAAIICSAPARTSQSCLASDVEIQVLQSEQAQRQEITDPQRKRPAQHGWRAFFIVSRSSWTQMTHTQKRRSASGVL